MTEAVTENVRGGARLLIVGAPGAGKGTQAVFIAESLGIPAVSTGDIFRYNIANETPLGLQVKEITSSGGYVPDSRRRTSSASPASAPRFPTPSRVRPLPVSSSCVRPPRVPVLSPVVRPAPCSSAPASTTS